MSYYIRKIDFFERNCRFIRCDCCLDELENGQGYYCLAGKNICHGCLPRLAEALFSPWLRIAGEEVLAP